MAKLRFHELQAGVSYTREQVDLGKEELIQNNPNREFVIFKIRGEKSPDLTRPAFRQTHSALYKWGEDEPDTSWHSGRRRTSAFWNIPKIERSAFREVKEDALKSFKEEPAPQSKGQKAVMPNDELTDAKIAAAEARTDTKFAKLDGKVDLLLERIASLSASTAALQASSTAIQTEVRSENRSTRTTIVVTAIATVISLFFGIVTLLAWGGDEFGRGIEIQSLLRSLAREEVRAPAIDASPNPALPAPSTQNLPPTGTAKPPN